MNSLKNFSQSPELIQCINNCSLLISSSAISSDPITDLHRMIYPHKISAISCWRLVTIATFILVTVGCTEMKVEGDAKIFQTSAVGAVIGTLLGLGLLILGGLGVLASFWPDRKPRNEYEAAEGGTPFSQRVGIGIFGAAMGFMGFFLTILSLIFPNSLHVTVYPDRVEMASTLNQARGKGVVIPYSNVKSVEIIDEPGIRRKRRNYLVFTLKVGGTIRQDVGNNERQALETLKQALADYHKRPPVDKPKTIAVVPPGANQPGGRNERARTEPARNEPQRTEPTTTARALDGSGFGVNTRLDAPSTKSSEASAADMVVGTLQNAMSPEAASGASSGKPSIGSMPATSSATATMQPGSSPTAPPRDNDKYRLKRYLITIPIQAGYSLVRPDTQVKVGMKLAACYSGHWEPVTVVFINSDGTITCDWDLWPGFTYKMLREDLTIADR